jgi:tetratricopeptide (TPR) repeat protein
VRFFFSLALSLTVAHAAAAQTAQEIRKQAFDLAYNLDRDDAIALLEKAREAAPEDPASYRALAAVTWLQILYQRGAVTVDHYLGGISRARIELRQPDPLLDKRFQVNLEQALTLAERRVAARPRDPQAHYDYGTALGLQASYTATVEGKLLAGFRAAKRAYDAHERVLALDGRRKDAGLVVGTYRYLVSALSLPMRWMAYVAGFGGGRERGARMIAEAADYPGESQVEARFALILVYNRERQYDAALQVLGTLEREYPRNRLIILEKGSTTLRAGRYADADRILSEGLARLARDTRRRIPGEEALWHYKRGAARLGAGRREEAVADLRAALAAKPAEWVAGRTRVELGKAADLAGDRNSARGEYEQAIALCDQGSDPICAEEARRRLAQVRSSKDER